MHGILVNFVLKSGDIYVEYLHKNEPAVFVSMKSWGQTSLRDPHSKNGVCSPLASVIYGHGYT